MGNYGTENGIPVTSLYTTITGTDKHADTLVDPDDDPTPIVIARVRATGKLTYVPIETDAEKRPTEYQRQQVLEIVGYDLITREEGTVKLYDDLARRIAKAKANRDGELLLEPDGEE